MLLLTIALLVIAGVISFFHFQYNDSGVLNLDLAGHTGSVPVAWLTYGIGAVILFLLAMWILGKVFSIPRRLRHGSTVRGMRKSRESLDQGLLHVQAGEFTKGEAALTKHLDGGAGDAVKYLTAAKSAQLRGADEDAEIFLKKAGDASNDASSAVRTTQAELMLQRGNFRDAETLLTNLHQSSPRNRHLMTLLATAMQGTGNSEGLGELTKAMRDRTLLPMDYIEPLEESAWVQSVANSSDEELTKTFDHLSIEARKNDSVLATYCRRLVNLGENEKAEGILTRALGSTWSEPLAEVFGEVESPNNVKQLETAEGWLADQPRSPALQLALGKISARRQLWGKSRDYLSKAAEYNLTPEVSLQLGEVLEHMGDDKNAKDCFRSAARLSAGQSAVGIMLDPSNLSSALEQVQKIAS